MSVSQAVLADILATSTATVQAWELGRTVPPPMCRLLEYVAGDRDRLSRVLSKSD
jgi:DNA-binding transcriptional regulator YiaG